MVSKTSLYNKTILKKNLTRFAPLWGGYTLLIVLSLLFNAINNSRRDVVYGQQTLMLVFAYLSVLYAPMAAAFLFNDLFNTRLCYTLHSLPVSRNAMFGSHILSGFLFQLIPSTVMALVSLPILLSCSQVIGAPHISLAAWAAANLQYLFFFGLAALCMVCVGNLLGFVAMYGLLNVAGYGTYVLLDNLFRPLLKGIVTPFKPFLLLTPIIRLNDNRYISIHVPERTVEGRHISIHVPELTVESRPTEYVYLDTGWPYAIAIAAVGLILIAVALLIYRRRNLETAGEFVSYKLLRPLILLSISLASGTAAALLLVPEDSRPLALRLLCLFLGMTLGYFLGLMLLNRSSQVFHRKNWVGLGLLLASMALLLGLTKLDPLGSVSRLPAREDISSVALIYRSERSMSSPEEIDDMRLLHSLALEETLSGSSDSNIEAYIPFRLTYELKNGAHMERSYQVHMDSEAGKLLCKHLTSLTFAAHNSQIKTPEDLLAQVHRPTNISLYCGRFYYSVPEEYLTEDTVEALYKALIADCQEGTMVQNSAYHPPVVLSDKDECYLGCDVYIAFPYSAKFNLSFEFYSDSQNILAWLDTIGLDSAAFWDRIVY